MVIDTIIFTVYINFLKKTIAPYFMGLNLAIIKEIERKDEFLEVFIKYLALISDFRH
jgi:hypothetical protein